MSERIEAKDLISPDVEKALSDLNKRLEDVVKTIVKVQQTAKGLDTQMKANVKSNNDAAKATKSVKDNIDVLAKSEAEIAKLQKQTSDVIAKARAERSQENKTLVSARVARTEQNKQVKESIELSKTEAGSIARLTIENKRLIRERNAVNASTDAGQAKIKALNAQINANNKTINENKSLLEQQKNNVGNYGSALDRLKFGFGVVTAAAGAAFGAIKIGQKILESTKTTNDQLTASITGASSAFNVFMKSIATGNITNLIDRMKEAARAGRDYAYSMAELGDLMRSYKVREADARAEIENSRNDMKDSNIVIGERIAIGEKLIEQEGGLLDLRKNILSRISDAEIKALAAQIGLREDQVASMIKEYAVTEELRSQASKYLDDRNKINKSIKDTNSLLEADTKAVIERGSSFQRYVDQDRKKLDELIDKYSELQRSTDENVRLYAAALERYNTATDEQLDVIANSLIEASSAEREYAQRVREIHEQLRTLRKQAADEEKARGEEARKALEERLKAENDSKKHYLEQERQNRLDAQQWELDSYAYLAEEKAILLTKQYIDSQRLNEQERMSEEQLADELLQISIQAIKDEIAYRENAGIDTLNERKQLTALLMEEHRREKDSFIAAKNEEIAKEKEKAAVQDEIRQRQFDLGFRALDLWGSIYDADSQRLEEKRQQDLANTNDNVKAKERIEAEYQRKQAALRRKQAIVDKVSALFGIALNTAMGVANASSKVVTLPLVPYIIAQGAIQAAIVASKPIPKFAKGVRNFEGGIAEVGERGSELLRYPDGSMALTPNRSTTTFLPKGTDVFTATETKKIVNENYNSDISMLVDEQRKTRALLASKKDSSLKITGRGWMYSTSRANTTINHIDKYFRC